MKLKWVYSIAMALISLLLLNFFPGYSYFLVPAYGVLAFLLSDNSRKSIIMINLPFVVFIIIPMILYNQLGDSFFPAKLFANEVTRVVLVLTQLSIITSLFIKTNKIKGLIYVLAFIAAIYSAFHGRDLQTFVAGFIFLLLATFIKLPAEFSFFRKFLWFFLPFMFLYILSPFWEPLLVSPGNGYNWLHNLPIILVVPAGICTGLIFKGFSLPYKLVSLALTTSLLALGGFVGYMNWFAYVNKEGIVEEKIPVEVIAHAQNDSIFLSGTQGEVIVLSFWSTVCGSCIKKFPDIEEFYKTNKNNDKIRFYSVNIPIRGDSEEGVFRLTKNYETPVFFGDDSWVDFFSITSFPTLIIIKDNVIRYKGLLTFDKNNYYNINKIIDREGSK